jgi:hypothetical protein
VLEQHAVGLFLPPMLGNLAAAPDFEQQPEVKWKAASRLSNDVVAKRRCTEEATREAVESASASAHLARIGLVAAVPRPMAATHVLQAPMMVGVSSWFGPYGEMLVGMDIHTSPPEQKLDGHTTPPEHLRQHATAHQTSAALQTREPAVVQSSPTSSRPTSRAPTSRSSAKPQRAPRRPTSQHRGVSLDKAKCKWRATIRVDGKLHHLGFFTKETDAAEAFKQSAAKVAQGQHIFPPRQELTSKHRGVSLEKGSGKWKAQIRVGGKKQHLGLFIDENEAATSYAEAAAMIRDAQLLLSVE